MLWTLLRVLIPGNARRAHSGKAVMGTRSDASVGFCFGVGIWISSYPFFERLNEPSGNLHFLFVMRCPPWLNAKLSRSTTLRGWTVDPGAIVPVVGIVGTCFGVSSTSIASPPEAAAVAFRSPWSSRRIQPKPRSRIVTSTLTRSSASLRTSFVHQTTTSRFLRNFVMREKLWNSNSSISWFSQSRKLDSEPKIDSTAAAFSVAVTGSR